MSDLEKIKALLTKENRTVKYGVLTTETDALLVGLTEGESLLPVGHLGDSAPAEYPTVEIRVYAADYFEGYALSKQLKAEIKAAQKETVKIVFNREYATSYDKEKQRYVFTTQYKIIKIQED